MNKSYRDCKVPVGVEALLSGLAATSHICRARLRMADPSGQIMTSHPSHAGVAAIVWAIVLRTDDSEGYHLVVMIKVWTL